MKQASSPNWQEYDRAGKVVARRWYDRAAKIFSDAAEDAGLNVAHVNARGGVTGKRTTQVIVDDPFDESLNPHRFQPELFPAKPPRPRRAK